MMISSDFEALDWNACVVHLGALRSAVIQCGIVFCVIFLVLFWLDEPLYTWIAKPLLLQLPAGGQIIATEITSTFIVPMKLAWISALIVVMPYILYKLWIFIAPGLYLHEKKTLLPLLGSSIILFYMGLCFAYCVICPLALKFFMSSAPKGVSMMTDIRLYLDFVLTLLFAGGLAFQVPVLTVFLLNSGIVTQKQLIHIRPYVIVGAFIIGMLLTPPDVVSQTLLALPMWGLFEVGLVISKLKFGK